MTRPLSYICRLMGLLLLAAVMPQQAAAAPAVIADTLAADSLYIYPLGTEKSVEQATRVAGRATIRKLECFAK